MFFQKSHEKPTVPEPPAITIQDKRLPGKIRSDRIANLQLVANEAGVVKVNDARLAGEKPEDFARIVSPEATADQVQPAPAEPVGVVATRHLVEHQ